MWIISGLTSVLRQKIIILNIGVEVLNLVYLIFCIHAISKNAAIHRAGIKHVHSKGGYLKLAYGLWRLGDLLTLVTPVR